MAKHQSDLNRRDLGAQATETLANLGKASEEVGGVIRDTAAGAVGKTVEGVKKMAAGGGRVLENGASIGLSATDGLANLARKNKEIAAVAVVIGGLAATWAWMRGVKKYDASIVDQASQADDLKARLAALQAARAESSARAGASNPGNTGHAAATGRGQGMSPSA